ncbi:MAG: rod shape-determining protein RodA [Bacteroidota bacterium]|nr:rod shape-determining protein RodA [Bacteroidota bacterium]
MINRKENMASGIDWITVVVYVVLVLIGWINIYAAVYNEEHKNIFDFSQRYGSQMILIAAAFIIATVIILVDLKVFTVSAYLLYGACILLLMLVLVVGQKVNGARSWFRIGSFGLQPAEFAKVATALALAKFMGSENIKFNNSSTFVIIGIIIGLPMLLILLQPDAGSLLVYLSFSIVLFREGLPGAFLLFGFMLGVLFITSLLLSKLLIVSIIVGAGFVAFAFFTGRYRETGLGFLLFSGLSLLLWAISAIGHLGLDYYYIIAASFVVSGIAFLVVSFFRKIRFLASFVLFLLGAILFTFSVDYVFHHALEEHQRTRMNILLGLESDPLGMGYNVNQSMIAIGSGGVLGKGFLQGTQTKYNFVPEQSTDFIFCTVGEEWGFVGTSVVIGLFLFLLLRIVAMAERQRSVFSRVYAYSVASIFFFHVAINVGMTIGLLPVIGIPLPFFSYGGSSLWSFTVLLFILLKLDSSRLELFR